MASKEQIRQDVLRKGYIDVKVYVAGLRQAHRLEVRMEDTPHGTVPFLICRNYIPNSELVRLAEDLQLPIKHKNTLVLPRGKSLKDFAGGKRLVVEPDIVEAEIED